MRILVLLLLLTSCGNHQLIHENVVYDCYGLFDKDEVKKPNVVYEISIGNMIGTFILSETVFVPVWNLGFNTYCPVKILEKENGKN